MFKLVGDLDWINCFFREFFFINNFVDWLHFFSSETKKRPEFQVKKQEYK